MECSATIILIIVVALVTSIKSQNSIFQVTRLFDGDIYELQTGEQCGTYAVPFVPTKNNSNNNKNNNNNPITAKPLCKCKSLNSTFLMFGCYNVAEQSMYAML